MGAIPSQLEIAVRLVDGTVNRFAQSDTALIMANIERVNPRKLYEEPHITIECSEGVLIYPTSGVVRIDFTMDFEPDWSLPHLNTAFKELTQEEFNALYTPEKDASLLREKSFSPGDEFHGLVHLSLAYNADAYFEVKTKLHEIRMEQGMVLSSVLKGSTISFPSAGGGYAFLNLANVLRFDLLPGQPDIAPKAWKLRWIDGDDETN